MPLFRPEALRGQDTLHGEVSLVPPVTWPMLVGFVLAAAAAAVIFMATATYAPVTLVPGVVSVTPRGADAVLDAPPDVARRITAGQVIWIAVDALPYQAHGALRAVVPEDGGNGVHARIPPSFAGRELLPGMTVTARIPGRPRSLLSWITDPAGHR